MAAATRSTRKSKRTTKSRPKAATRAKSKAKKTKTKKTKKTRKAAAKSARRSKVRTKKSAPKRKAKKARKTTAKPGRGRTAKAKAKNSKKTKKSKTVTKAKPKAAAKPKTKPKTKPKKTTKTDTKTAAKAAPKPASKPAPRTVAHAEAPQPHLFAAMLVTVRAACAAALGPDVDLSRVLVEPPRDPSHGDMATNAAMVLAKSVGLNPREFADRIAAGLRGDARVEKVDVAGPGFINLTLRNDVWGGALLAALEQGKDYGRSDIGQGEAVNVEYVSANPTGPMHVGHCRGAVFGDALASLLAFVGYDVTREYYINDAGAQVEVLARSAYLRYREALGEPIGEIPEGLYPGEYLKEVGGELAADYGPELTTMPEDERLKIARERAINVIMADIRNDLMRLNVIPNMFFSERTLIEGEEHDPFSPHPPPEREADVVAETIMDLRGKGLVYEGRLPPPKSGNLEDWEDREQTLFRSTQFGDDVDRPLLKSDGSYTYFATDIAYHKSKLDRGFKHLIDVWGADHGGYVKRMTAAVKALSDNKVDLDVKLVQLVRLLRHGEPVKMSKRAGEFVTLREVVEEVGRDAVRFDMLFRKNDAALDFDLAKVIEASRDNPVFYVQYGHARGQSVFRNARAEMPELPAEPDARVDWLKGAGLSVLDDPGELSLLRKIALYPRTVEAAAAAHEPHRIAFYLYDLASEFHAQWTRGKDLPHLRFIIQNDPQTTRARLALVQGIVIVLASGLALLGVEAPEEMR
jgi:arginyl-tRNA synthetase